MRKVIYTSMVTLDGFIEGPNHKLGWEIIDEELHRFVNERERAIGLHLYGRRMYELMESFWPTADANPANPAFEIEYSTIWKSIPILVFSKSLERVEGNARLVRDDPAGVVARLKEEPGKDIGIGGAILASALVERDLIDGYQLYVHPVVLGSGTRLRLALNGPINLRLVETHTFNTGAVFLHYQRINEELNQSLPRND